MGTQHRWHGWTITKIRYGTRAETLKADGKFLTILYTDFKKMKADLRKYPNGDPLNTDNSIGDRK